MNRRQQDRRTLAGGALLLMMACAVAATRAPIAIDSRPSFSTAPAAPRLALDLAQARKTDLPMPLGMPAAHASNLIAQGNQGDLRAAWFAGSRESGSDVVIATSIYSAAEQRWSPAQVLVDRPRLSKALGFAVRRLGNPVLWADSQGKLHLFVVATGPGGWAASRIAHVQFSGESSSCQVAPERCELQAQVLPLSPLWNISYLVRHAPVCLADGGFVLPVYFELGRKYPVALRFDARGGLRQMQRLSAEPHLLQPAMVSPDGVSWSAWMRDDSASRRVHSVAAPSWGGSPQPVRSLELRNPNSALAAVRLPDGTVVLALNPNSEDRHTLALVRSADLRTWSTLGTLEASSDAKGEYSYPALALSTDPTKGWTLHASYTFERRLIRHVAIALSPAQP